MKKILGILQLITLSFASALILGFLITPGDVWGTFGSSPDGHHLLVVHLLMFTC